MQGNIYKLRHLPEGVSCSAETVSLRLEGLFTVLQQRDTYYEYDASLTFKYYMFSLVLQALPGRGFSSALGRGMNFSGVCRVLLAESMFACRHISLLAGP